MTALFLTLALHATPQPTAPAARVVVTVGTTLVATGIAIAAGALIHSAPLAIEGRPSPWATTGAFAVGVGVNAALSHLVAPWLNSLLDPRVPVETIRAQAWQSSRWALLGGGVGVVTYSVGAGLEQSAFGRGQAVMLAGALISVVALFAWDVVETIGIWSATR